MQGYVKNLLFIFGSCEPLKLWNVTFYIIIYGVLVSDTSYDCIVYIIYF